MERIGNLIKNKGIDTPVQGKQLVEWQLWALDFCKKFKIPRNEYGTIMRTAKNYQNNIDYLRGVAGYLSDYPNLEYGQGTVRILLWKLKKDREEREVLVKKRLIYM